MQDGVRKKTETMKVNAIKLSKHVTTVSLHFELTCDVCLLFPKLNMEGHNQEKGLCAQSHPNSLAHVLFLNSLVVLSV